MNTVDDITFKVKGKSVSAPAKEIKALPADEHHKALMRLKALGSAVAGFAAMEKPKAAAPAAAAGAGRARSPSPKPAAAPKKDLHGLGIDIGDWMLGELMKNKAFAKAYDEEGDEMDILSVERDKFGDTPRQNVAMVMKIAKAFPDVNANDVRDALVERYEGHYQFGELVKVLKSMRISDTRKKSK